MTLAQLRYFCTAAQYHSITKAAEALFVTQPTISIAVRDLEKEFPDIVEKVRECKRMRALAPDPDMGSGS